MKISKQIGRFDGRFWFKEDPFDALIEIEGSMNPWKAFKYAQELTKEGDNVIAEVLMDGQDIVGIGAIYTPFPKYDGEALAISQFLFK